MVNKMITELFGFLTTALESNVILAVFASFLWGVLSILLSPCHLSSIPLIVSFVDIQGAISTKRAFLLSFLFSFGILVTIAVIGLITGLMGGMLGGIGPYGNYIVAVIFFITGLYLLEVISFPFTERLGQPEFKKKGLFAAFILGLVFGIALGPCTFAYMAPMLGITFKIAATQFLYGVVLLFVYGIGHCSVIVFAGTFAEIVQNYLNWNEKSKGTIIIKKICGILIILGGIYLIWNS